MTMKKIFMAAMALVMLIGSTSCNKENVVDTETVKGQLVFNYTVGEKPGSVDTKALKSGWAEGDQIIVVFYHDTDWDRTSPLVIEYNGSAWTTKVNPDASGWDVTKKMKYLAVHYRRQDNTQNMSCGNDLGGWYRFQNFFGGEVLEQMGDLNVVDGEVNINIDLDYSASIFLVSIPGLDVDDDWRLGLLDGTEPEGKIAAGSVSSHYPLSAVTNNLASGSLTHVTNSADNMVSVNPAYNSNAALARCVENDGQITFAFRFYSSKNTPATYTFLLSKGMCTPSNDKYVYTVNDVTFAGKKAYKLPVITDNTKWVKSNKCYVDQWN